jgi:hypothetical protein
MIIPNLFGIKGFVVVVSDENGFLFTKLIESISDEQEE